MDQAQTRFVVITPVRNEAAHLEFTMRSMVSQSIRPSECVIVDDGSTDRISEIIGFILAFGRCVTPGVQTALGAEGRGERNAR